ncbi:MAG TPA: hypothetical protein VJS45_03625 [Acidimicrobiia bacterium]|nr:hypothetical protein [Acidimicrobiia bacterium]
MWIGIATCYSAGFDDLLTPGRLLTAAALARDFPDTARSGWTGRSDHSGSGR